MENEKSGREVIVIGGGCGGLFTAALLAKKSFRVTVLEKNAAIGGGLSTFRRNGIAFQPGMHIVGGFSDKDSPRRTDGALSTNELEAHTSKINEVKSAFVEADNPRSIETVFKELGIKAEVRDCPRRMAVLSDSSVRDIPVTKEAVVEMLGKEFPYEKAGIEAYYRRIDEICKFRQSEMQLDGLMSADTFIEQFTSDPKLKAIFGSLNLLTGTEAGITPALTHSIINELYTRQFSYFPNGTEDIVRQLTDIIESAGGRILNKTAVSSLHFGTDDNGKRCVTAVETSDGTLHTADIYISDIPPARLAEISRENGTFSKIQLKRITSLRDGFSMFTVYAKVRNGSPVPEGATFCFPNYDSVWRQGSIYNGDWLHGALFVRFGEQLTAMAAMPFSMVERWENGRNEEYRRWKDEQTGRILSLLNSYMSILNNHTADQYIEAKDITVLCSASPLSIRDWLGNRHGAAYGFSIDYQNPLSSRLSAKTKADNLFLTGQSLFLHGLCGTVMSAVTTAREIVTSPL